MAVLVLLSIPIIFYRLGSYSLVNNDEAVYHYIARNMVETGNWFRLEFTGEHRVYDTFMNAPIQYWARAALITALGDNYWTMRILSAVFGLLCVLMTYRLVAFVAGARAALLAGLVQLTTFQYVHWHCARTGELEPVVCFLITLAAYLFLQAVETKRSFVPHHICLIALMNLKLPLVGVPVLAELAFFALSPEARGRFRGWLRAGLIVPLGLAWHVVQAFAIREEAFTALKAMFGEASGSFSRTPASKHNNVPFYTKTVLFGAFPYALVYPVAIVGLLAARAGRKEQLRWRLILLFPAAVVGFFIGVQKSFPWYIIPAYPFLCAGLGIWLEGLRRATRYRWVIVASTIILASLCCVRVGSVNPFSVVAFALARSVAWRTFFDASPALGVPIVMALLASVLYVARLLLRARFATVVSYSLTLALIGSGAIRVLRPLGFTRYTSEMDALKHRLAAEQAAGEPYRFPIPVREPGEFKVRFFFGDDFDIVNNGGRRGIQYWLVREGRTSQKPPPLRTPSAAGPKPF